MKDLTKVDIVTRGLNTKPPRAESTLASFFNSNEVTL